MAVRRRFIYALALLLVAVFVLPKAWVSDDAYVTFRVVDNLVHGYGLRWNTDERVQAYTNPLWLLLHVPFYALWGNIYLTTIGLSLICIVAAVAMTLSMGLRWHGIAVFCAVMFLCDPFNDFATSGLETPLTLLLWACFARAALKENPGWFELVFIASLAYVNRMDTVLAMLPALALFAYRKRREIDVRAIVLGTLPAIAWSEFALFYYGFLFPNTKYAKLHSGLELWVYIKQGAAYFYDLGVRQSVAFIAMVTGLAVTGRWLSQGGKRTYVALGLGAWLYCLYVLLIGGDFMSGRMLVLPVFIFAYLSCLWLSERPARAGWAVLAGVLLLKGMNACFYEDALGEAIVGHRNKNVGIVVERSFYVHDSGLWSDPQRLLRIEPSGGYWVYQMPNLFNKLNPYRVMASGSIGFFGFYGGPKAKLIDLNALADPLLARLPIPEDSDWRIGHMARAVPYGYIPARGNGDVSRMALSLASYYEKLRLVTSGDLWSFERLETIAGFQFGEYDHWLEEYNLLEPPK